jgi:hypothetical protein
LYHPWHIKKGGKNVFDHLHMKKEIVETCGDKKTNAIIVMQSL